MHNFWLLPKILHTVRLSPSAHYKRLLYYCTSSMTVRGTSTVRGYVRTCYFSNNVQSALLANIKKLDSGLRLFLKTLKVPQQEFLEEGKAEVIVQHDLVVVFELAGR